MTTLGATPSGNTVTALAFAQAFTTTNFTRTVNTHLLITGTNALRFSIAASERWAFWCCLSVECDNTGGVAVAVDGPSGATVEAGAVGIGTGTASARNQRMSALATGATAFAAVATTAGPVVLGGQMLNSTTPGTLDIMAKPVTNGQLATVYAGAVLLGWRIA